MPIKKKNFDDSALNQALDGNMSDRQSIMAGLSEDKKVPQRRNKKAVLTAEERLTMRPVQVMVTPEERKKLKNICNDKDISLQEFLRSLIKEAISI